MTRGARVIADPLPLDLPPQPVQPPTGNEVALWGTTGTKAHRALNEDRPVEPGRRPSRSRRDAGAHYDGEARQTRCGWHLTGVRHVLVATVDPQDRCRICWPVAR